jgi:cob(I)alamin adenosyltransferase
MVTTQSINAHGMESHLNSLGNNDGNKLVLMSAGDYQSAQALAREALNIFERKLVPLAHFENNERNTGMSYMSRLGDSLVELNNMLNNKASPEDFMELVHIQIHPSLQLAYKLGPVR